MTRATMKNEDLADDAHAVMEAVQLLKMDHFIVIGMNDAPDGLESTIIAKCKVRCVAPAMLHMAESGPNVPDDVIAAIKNWADHIKGPCQCPECQGRKLH